MVTFQLRFYNGERTVNSTNLRENGRNRVLPRMACPALSVLAGVFFVGGRAEFGYSLTNLPYAVGIFGFAPLIEEINARQESGTIDYLLAVRGNDRRRRCPQVGVMLVRQLKTALQAQYTVAQVRLGQPQPFRVHAGGAEQETYTHQGVLEQNEPLSE